MKAEDLRLQVLSKVRHCRTNRDYYIHWGGLIYRAKTPSELVNTITAKLPKGKGANH